MTDFLFGGMVQANTPINITSALVAANVSVTGSGIPTNGIYAPNANQLGFATNSTQVVTIASNGNVGIGTGTPTTNANNQLTLFNATAAGIELATGGATPGGANIIGITGGGLTVSTFAGGVGTETYAERLRITNAGNISTTGNIAIGNVSGPYNSGTGRAYLTVQGSGVATSTGAGIIQLATNAAGSTNPYPIGNIEWHIPDNTSSTGTRVGFITMGGLGASANNIGSYMHFATKADGVAGVGAVGMMLTGVGNLLIGTTTAPGAGNGNATVVIQGVGTNGGGIELSGGTAGGGNIFALNGAGLAFSTYTGPVGTEVPTERMRIDAFGNVGVGTAAPSAKFDLAGEFQISNGNNINWKNSSGTSIAMLTLSGTNDFIYGGSGAFVGAHRWYSSGAERMRINSSGFVGIGTNNPSYQLDVNGYAMAIGPTASSPGTGGQLRYRDDSGTLRWTLGLLGTVGNTAYSIYDNVNSAERMRITSAGNVSITNSLTTPYSWGQNHKSFGFGYTNTQLYWQIGTLPATSSGTADAIYIEITGLTTSINGKGKLKVAVGQRGSFWYSKAYEGPDPRVNVQVYQQADGSSNVWVYNSQLLNYVPGDVQYYTYGWNPQNSFNGAGIGATIYDVTGPGSASTPPGTLIFDSANNTTYPVSDSLLTGIVGVGTSAQIGTAKLSILGGTSNATQYNTIAATGGSTMYVNQQQTTSVSTSATTILATPQYATLALVHGSDGTNRFSDLVLMSVGTGTVNVISSLNAGGSPAARTYTQASSTFKLAMASGTYTVQVSAICMNS